MKHLLKKPFHLRVSIALSAIFLLVLLVSQAKGFADVGAGQTPPSHTGVVAAGERDPTISVYKKPSQQATKMGTLKNGAEVTVTSVQNHWAAVNEQNKTVYIPLQYIKFYKTLPQDEAKTIVDTVIAAQRKTWIKAYTKAEIESLMAPYFTKDYIQAYTTQLFRQTGKKEDGTLTYHILETEIQGLAIDSFDWQARNDQQKPTVTYYIQDGVAYLKVAQYHMNEESGNHMSTLYLFKQPGQPNWKVYDYITVY